ncbi:hypothetical protein LIA77_05413 [Sarocladium implicatum]|nr:hypothetical protein LIA77_05413 [Sarocladium implicatum]
MVVLIQVQHCTVRGPGDLPLPLFNSVIIQSPKSTSAQGACILVMRTSLGLTCCHCPGDRTRPYRVLYTSYLQASLVGPWKGGRRGSPKSGPPLRPKSDITLDIGPRHFREILRSS